MKKKNLYITGIPSILWGESADNIYLYIHGQNGNKEEAKVLSEIVCRNGWQVLSIDLPGHGERKNEMDSFNPWHIVEELKQVMNYMKTNWHQAALYANSIGAWFSMLSFLDISLKHCLFVSPILDMKQLINNRMKWANVTESQLQKEQLIPTTFGQTLSWEYLVYVKNHPILKWENTTSILYGQKDTLTEQFVVDDFVKRFCCRLTVMEEGEHWFHTPQQLKVLTKWIKDNYDNDF